jgi:hypothetical protein
VGLHKDLRLDQRGSRAEVRLATGCTGGLLQNGFCAVTLCGDVTGRQPDWTLTRKDQKSGLHTRMVVLCTAPTQAGDGYPK